MGRKTLADKLADASTQKAAKSKTSPPKPERASKRIKDKKQTKGQEVTFDESPEKPAATKTAKKKGAKTPAKRKSTKVTPPPSPKKAQPGTLLHMARQYTETTTATDIQTNEIELLADFVELVTNSELRPTDVIGGMRLVAHPEWMGYLFVTDNNDVRVMHSIGEVLCKNTTNKDHGSFIAFIGDREVDPDGSLLEPPTMYIDPDDVFRTNAINTADVIACGNSPVKKGRTLLGIDQRPPMEFEDIPFVLPCPLSQLEYFLERPRTVRETCARLQTMRMAWPPTTQGTTFHDSKDLASELTLGWAAGSVTYDNSPAEGAEDPPTPPTPPETPENADEASILLFPVGDIATLTGEAHEWAPYHLNLFLPMAAPTHKPAPAARTEETDDEEEEEEDPPPLSRRDTLLEKAFETMSTQADAFTAFAAQAAQRDADRAEQASERAGTLGSKKLSEVLEAKILGFAGLGWEERTDYTSVFHLIAKQTDKASKYIILDNLFAQLAKRERSFRHFRNRRLYDDIIAHNLVPGMEAHTAHYGLSPLTMILRDANAIMEDDEEAAIYEEVTTRTTDTVRAQRKTKPPPLPNTLTEWLMMTKRYFLVLKATLGTKCNLYIQVRDFHYEIDENQRLLERDAAWLDRSLPLMTWAIVNAAHQFFGTSTTRSELEATPPEVVKCTLQLHATMFAAGTSHEIAGMPVAWRTPRLPAQQPGPGKSKGKRDTETRPKDAPNDQRDTKRVKEERTNLHGPPAFTNAKELHEVIEKFHRITLSDICKEAGFKNPTDLGTRVGLSARECLNFNALGICQYPNCRNNHINMPNDKAAAMWGHLKPAVLRILSGHARVYRGARA